MAETDGQKFLGIYDDFLDKQRNPFRGITCIRCASDDLIDRRHTFICRKCGVTMSKDWIMSRIMEMQKRR